MQGQDKELLKERRGNFQLVISHRFQQYALPLIPKRFVGGSPARGTSVAYERRLADCGRLMDAQNRKSVQNHRIAHGAFKLGAYSICKGFHVKCRLRVRARSVFANRAGPARGAACRAAA